MEKSLTKIVVIVGPTASGKSGLAIELAKRFPGEVVSADSRQVYRGLDIGTGKVTKEEMSGIPHHLLDIADPTEVYTAADFVRDADATIEDIASRGKLPIVAGGTFFYIEALLGTKQVAEVPPNEPLRRELSEKSAEELYALLAERDPAYTAVVDRHNPRRLIRALEIAEALGAVPIPSSEQRYDALIIGIDVPREALKEKIEQWVRERFDGIHKEAERLTAEGLPSERMSALGFIYETMQRHLAGTLTRKEAGQEMVQKDWQYARRQRTWLRSMEDVQWFAPEQYSGVVSTVETFLRSGGPLRGRPRTRKSRLKQLVRFLYKKLY